jgi:hypothetical protein
MKKSALISLPILLVAIASAKSQGVEESWARQIFAPSAETLKTACAQAYADPKDVKVGGIQLKLASGSKLQFESALYPMYGYCKLNVSSNSFEVLLKSDAYSFWSSRVKFSALIIPQKKYSDQELQTKATISLHGKNGQELLRLKPKTDVSGFFNFELVTMQERTKLDSVRSFTIELTSNSKVEKLKIDPTKFSAFSRLKAL